MFPDLRPEAPNGVTGHGNIIIREITRRQPID